MEVEFDSLKHEYKINGSIVPGVSNILGQDPEVFRHAAIRKGLDPDFYAKRGTAVHLMIYCYENNLLNPVCMTEDMEGYLNAWIKFRTENKIVIFGMERIVASKDLMLAGTFDIVCMMNGFKWILDIKSGSQTPHHAIQLSCYKKLYIDDSRYRSKPPDKLGGVYLRTNGNYSFKEFKYDLHEVLRLRSAYV